MHADPPASSAAEQADFIRRHLPQGGLFQDQKWRISPEPFVLPEPVASEIVSLGRVLLQFYRALNLLYRQSLEGKQPGWVAQWLDLGKPADLLALQRSQVFKNDVPRVIRPDLLLTDTGLSIMELDSVPGGIGLTAWLNQTYSHVPKGSPTPEGHAGGAGELREVPEPFPPAQRSRAGRKPAGQVFNPDARIIGGADGMLQGFRGIFGDAPAVHIVVSEEAATYVPEMRWMASQLGESRFQIHQPDYDKFAPGDAVYRFFELFDLPNVPAAGNILEAASNNALLLTPPPKMVLEEKMMFALLWNRNLADFWRQQLGQAFFNRLLAISPRTWLMDPAPIPPHAAIPELNLTDWGQLKSLSQRERELIIKVSGFSADAWGARGVYLGSDLPQGDWAAAVDRALASFATSPYILQRYAKPALTHSSYYDFASSRLVPMPGRVRLCPYYFVIGEGDAARANLGGVLATICPADKKIIHGMRDAILAPCAWG